VFFQAIRNKHLKKLISSACRAKIHSREIWEVLVLTDEQILVQSCKENQA